VRLSDANHSNRHWWFKCRYPFATFRCCDGETRLSLSGISIFSNLIRITRNELTRSRPRGKHGENISHLPQCRTLTMGSRLTYSAPALTWGKSRRLPARLARGHRLRTRLVTGAALAARTLVAVARLHGAPRNLAKSRRPSLAVEEARRNVLSSAPAVVDRDGLLSYR
jgi:hypothetical protein